MAQKEVNGRIILSGQIKQSFNNVVSRVEAFASTVNQVSDKLTKLGEESVETYKDYQTNMLAAYSIFRENLGVNEATRAMDTLEKKAQEWASSTIFHTDDVSRAIYNASQAGWDLNDQLEGIPRAMLLAQAGELDLQEGLSYLARALNATKTEFSQSGKFVDQWVKASTLANLSIQDLGESMSAMGLTATFAGDNAILLAMLDVLAETGTVGSQAGTQLRAAMLRIVAPTKKASEAFESMGADAEELEELLEDEALMNAGQRLEELGFSAYDQKGNLKDFLTILTDMDAAMAGLSEQERNALLKDIFPTRTFATAKALLDAIATGTLPELVASIEDSEGASQRRSDTMMSGLMGDLELLSSKWEELERKFGSVLSDQVSSVAGGIGSIIDKLNEMPEEALSALVGGLGTISGLGIGAGFGAGVLRFFGALGGWGTTILLTAAGVGALVGYLQELDDQNWNSHFGNVKLDVDALMETVNGMKTPFTETKTAISEWEQAVSAAQQSYESLTSSLSAETLQAALSGKTLTDAETATLKGYGQSIGQAVLDGVSSAKQRDLSFLYAIFGDQSSQAETDAFVMGSDVVDAFYSDLYADAYNIGQKLREQMTAALTDKTLDEQEREAIQATIDRMNEIQRQITNRADQESYYSELYKAQHVSWDSIEDYTNQTAQAYKTANQGTEELYAREYGILMAAFDDAIKNGKTFEWNGRTRQATEKDRKAALAELEREKAAALQGNTDTYGGFMETAMRAVMETGWGDALNVIDFVRGQAKERDQNGVLTFADVDWASLLGAGFGDKEANSLYDLSKNAGRLKQKFEPFRDFPAVGEMLDYLDYAFELGEKLSGAGMAWDTFQSSGGTYDPLGLFSTEEQRAAYQRYFELPGEIEKAQSRLTGLREELAHAAEKRDQYAKNGNTANYGVWDAQFNTIRDAIPEAQAQLAMLQAEFDAFNGELPILLPDGKTKAQEFSADVQANLSTATMDIILNPTGGGGLDGYAEGGRATEASIFGEDGAEWAIPEEHSLRTASLLNQARQASGFTWGELDAMSGGSRKKNSAESVEIHITYAPNVNAQDARGVDAALKADKERMGALIRQVMEEEKMKDRAAVFA
jgi:TP901 family phage tail tape measure protein